LAMWKFLTTLGVVVGGNPVPKKSIM
jgi:hypothetical protein